MLEGSVRKAGDRVRITAQLVDTADGYHLFSNTYDRVLEDIFAVQDEIASTIAQDGAVVFVRHNFVWEDLTADPRLDEILGAVGL